MKKGFLLFSSAATVLVAAMMMAWSTIDAPSAQHSPVSLSLTDKSTTTTTHPQTEPTTEADPARTLTHSDLWTRNATTSAAEAAVITRFSSQLRAYSAGEFDHDERLIAEDTLRKVVASDAGRAFVADAFFSNDAPEQAAAIYNMILAADIKDPALISSLIKQDETESSTDYKFHIIDLIADLSTRDDVPFSIEIESYLSQLTQHPDSRLRQAAISRSAWYAAQHPQADIRSINEYLLSCDTESRREILELIEQRATGGNQTDSIEFALTLQSLLSTDYLGIAPEERKRIVRLIDTLQASQN